MIEFVKENIPCSSFYKRRTVFHRKTNTENYLLHPKSTHPIFTKAQGPKAFIIKRYFYEIEAIVQMRTKENGKCESQKIQ